MKNDLIVDKPFRAPEFDVQHWIAENGNITDQIRLSDFTGKFKGVRQVQGAQLEGRAGAEDAGRRQPVREDPSEVEELLGRRADEPRARARRSGVRVRQGRSEERAGSPRRRQGFGPAREQGDPPCGAARVQRSG